MTATVVGNRSCFICEYLPVCNVKERVRKKLNGNGDLLELFRTEAGDCNEYTLNSYDLCRQELERKQKTTVEVQTR